MLNVCNIFTVTILSGFFLISCSKQTVPSANSSSGSKSGVTTVPCPPCIVYKTRNDYNKLVPVMLTDDKTTLASYPDIKDIFYNNGISYPTVLSKGYLLDNRGIGPNVAFISYTYESYSRLPKTPDGKELFKLIIDNEPLLEMYFCGNRSKYTDPVKTLNDIILKGELNQFTRVK